MGPSCRYIPFPLIRLVHDRSVCQREFDELDKRSKQLAREAEDAEDSFAFKQIGSSAATQEAQKLAVAKLEANLQRRMELIGRLYLPTSQKSAH
eukprot:3393472-Pyramimonas_sp.AAC.1